MSSYAFDNAAVVETTQRFASLEHCYDPVTVDRLSAVGVGPGWSCLEVGAGTGSIAGWLAGRVGESGSIIATDVDTQLLGPLPINVEVWAHDIVQDALPDAAFDLVHARLVLLHLPERVRALERIRRALRPGGVLVLDEFDCTWLPVLAAPDGAAEELFVRVVDGIHELLRRSGADLAWGRNAYAALLAAGFVDLDVRSFSERWQGGSTGIKLHRANALQTGHRLIDAGLISADELSTFLELLDHPGLAVSSYLMLSTSGRRAS